MDIWENVDSWLLTVDGKSMHCLFGAVPTLSANPIY
jgi:hypothetical protein